MSVDLKFAVCGALVFFGLQILLVELLKAAKNPGLKNSEADVKATQTRAWLGVWASLCAFGQLVMLGWALFLFQALTLRP